MTKAQYISYAIIRNACLVLAGIIFFVNTAPSSAERWILGMSVHVVGVLAATLEYGEPDKKKTEAGW